MPSFVIDTSPGLVATGTAFFEAVEALKRGEFPQTWMSYPLPKVALLLCYLVGSEPTQTMDNSLIRPCATAMALYYGEIPAAQDDDQAKQWGFTDQQQQVNLQKQFGNVSVLGRLEALNDCIETGRKREEEKEERKQQEEEKKKKKEEEKGIAAPLIDLSGWGLAPPVDVGKDLSVVEATTKEVYRRNLTQFYKDLPKTEGGYTGFTVPNRGQAEDALYGISSTAKMVGNHILLFHRSLRQTMEELGGAESPNASAIRELYDPLLRIGILFEIHWADIKKRRLDLCGVKVPDHVKQSYTTTETRA